MKKLLSAFAMALLLVGCAKEYNDKELRDRVTTLETKVGNLEAQMKAANAVALGQYVQKVEKTDEGVTVTYGDGTVVSLKISAGGAGSLEVIKKGDDLVWAIDGEALQYDGKDLLVSQVTNIYVKDGKLYAVIAGTEKELGGFDSGTTLKDGIFKNIEVTADNVVLTLSDNSTVNIPIGSAFKLVIPKTTYAVENTNPFDVAYSVNAKITGTEVNIFTDGNYTATVEDSKFVVTPKAVVPGSALAYADSKVGLTSIVKLTFGAEEEQPYAEPTDEPYSESIDYIGEAADGSVNAHIVSNISLDKNSIKPQVDWISVADVKANNYTITLTLQDNPTEEIRQGEVWIYEAGTENKVQTLVIAQKAKEAAPVPQTFRNWEKVLKLTGGTVNTTFKWDTPLDLNPGAVTLQWKFYAKAWHDHNDGANANRLAEFVGDGGSVLLRFSNAGDADGQLCLNATAMGLNQVQVKKGNEAYVWPTGKWVVLTIVCDGSKLYLYDDASLVASYDVKPGSSWKINRYDLSMTADGYTNKQDIDGALAFARVWSRALSVSDIATTLCDVPAAQKENLEIYWAFDGAEPTYIKNEAKTDESFSLDFEKGYLNEGGRAADKSSDARNSWVTPTDFEIDAVCEKGAEPEPEPTTTKALSFAKTGAQNWYVFQNDIELSSGYTYVVHFLTTKVDALWPIMMKMSAKKTQSNPTCHRFMNSKDRTGASDFAHIAVSWNNGTSVHIRNNKVLEANTWYSIAFTNDPTAGVKCYIDGELTGEGTADADAISKMLFGAIEFGDSWGDDGYTPKPFPGCLAKISVWDKALSADEVAALVKKAPANLNDAHLKAYWPMNEGEGGLLKEATGKYEDIDFKHGWSDRYGGTYGTGEDLDNTAYLEWVEVPAI